MSQERKGLKVVLRGASFSTGNLGVSALADGALRGILDEAGDARVVIMSGSGGRGEVNFEHNGRTVRVDVMPIGYGKNVFRTDHVLALYLMAGLARIAPGKRVAKWLAARSAAFRAIREADIVADISAGDSFTDIYGPRRMIIQTLIKSLFFAAGKEMVLLPQTIGPFRHAASRAAARFVLKRAKAVYARDAEGVEEAQRVTGGVLGGRIRFAPDLGVLVEPAAPADKELLRRLVRMSEGGVLVGMNVSGLLLSGGYSGANQFSLKADYGALNTELARRLLGEPGVSIVFVPHVRAGGGWNMEDDLAACEAVRAGLSAAERERTFAVEQTLGVREAKYVIGRCAFFVGSRMHACIAALTQGVPAVGLAYSVKFGGVFETLGAGDLAVDLRAAPQEEVVERVLAAYRGREERRGRIVAAVPAAKAQARAALRELCALGRQNA